MNFKYFLTKKSEKKIPIFKIQLQIIKFTLIPFSTVSDPNLPTPYKPALKLTSPDQLLSRMQPIQLTIKPHKHVPKLFFLSPENNSLVVTNARQIAK